MADFFLDFWDFQDNCGFFLQDIVRLCYIKSHMFLIHLMKSDYISIPHRPFFSSEKEMGDCAGREICFAWGRPPREESNGWVCDECHTEAIGASFWGWNWDLLGPWNWENLGNLFGEDRKE